MGTLASLPQPPPQPATAAAPLDEVSPAAGSPSARRRLPRRDERESVGLADNVVQHAEDLVHYTVAAVLIAVALVVLGHTIYSLAAASDPFAQATTAAVNGVLFAVIIIEVMRTVMAHFGSGKLKLEPLLIIGIISAVREMLTVGARLSLQSSGPENTAAKVHAALLQLGVNGAVVVGLVVALVLVRRLGESGSPTRRHSSRERSARFRRAHPAR